MLADSKYLKLFFCLLFSWSAKSNASNSPFGGTAFADASTIQEESDGYEEELFSPDEDQDRELRLNGSEVRDDFKFGLNVGLGRFAPYQSVGLYGDMILNPHLSAQLGVGGGSTDTEQRENKIYSVKYQAMVGSAALKYFIMDDLPAYLSFGVISGGLRGKLETAGHDDESGIRKFKFKTTVISAFTGLGFQGHWSNGFSIDYTVIGINKGLWFKKTALGEDDAQHALESYIKKAEAFGLINLRVGYYW